MSFQKKCPHCKQRHHTTRIYTNNKKEKRWHCWTCGAEFGKNLAKKDESFADFFFTGIVKERV